jgi:DNA-binding MarR family transcriptional regulator
MCAMLHQAKPSACIPTKCLMVVTTDRTSDRRHGTARRVLRRFAVLAWEVYRDGDYAYASQRHRAERTMGRVKKVAGAVASRHGRKRDYWVDDQPGFLFRLVLKRHTTIFTDSMVGGLTPPQFTVLARLIEIEPTSQNYLGRLVAFDQATIKGIVDRLEKRHLVEVRPDPSDKRRHIVVLTTKGRKLAETAIEVAKDITKRTVIPLSSGEQKCLIRLLKKLI